MAVLSNHTNNYFLVRLATGVDGDIDYICSNIFTFSSFLRGKSLFFRNAYRFEFTNFIFNTADGNVRLLFKGVQAKNVELMEIFRGIMPFLGIVIFAMFLMYLFPGIALWLPDTLFAN